MPKRKVLQTVIVYRDGQRIKPTLGEIFDFQQSELDQINRLNPQALGRPVLEVDVENQAAIQKAKEDQQKAESEAQSQAKVDEKAQAGNKGKGKGGDKKAEEDEV